MDVPIEKTATSLSPKCAQMQHPTLTPSSSTQTYQYLPLKHDRDIRLLYLLPGSDEAPLSCSIRIVSLSEPPVYEAVSYTWGEPIFSAAIECFSKGQLPITENLSAALLHLRLVDRLRVLWVDAICINQQDLVERSHQVISLRETFEKAENVIVWLGEDMGGANEAFEIFGAIHNLSSDSHIADLVDHPEKGKALRDFLGRSWFRRIWVVQELICARKATITCGKYVMEWETFLDAAKRLKTSYHLLGHLFGPETRSVQFALKTLALIYLGRQMRKRREKSHLEELLYGYRHCLASDPRDKIFALVGIAHRQTAAACSPDYSKDVLEVYRDLAIQLIIAERNPDILTNCAYIVGSQVLLLPSWVPDWSQPSNTNSSPIATPDAYKASAGTSFIGRVSEDLRELFLDGIFLSKVEVLGEPWELQMLKDDRVKQIKREIERNEEYLDMFRQSPCYRGCYWSAFTRALVADRDHLGSRVGQRDLSEVYITCRKSLSRNLLKTVTKRFSHLRESAERVKYQERKGFDLAYAYAAYGRTFCIFDDGRAGWVPATAEAGDRIAIFLGATVPILLRPRGNGYIVLGEAYVHEKMDGQAFEGPDVQIETITLI